MIKTQGSGNTLRIYKLFQHEYGVEHYAKLLCGDAAGVPLPNYDMEWHQ
jgi:hypothetical protein